MMTLCAPVVTLINEQLPEAPEGLAPNLRAMLQRALDDREKYENNIAALLEKAESRDCKLCGVRIWLLQGKTKLALNYDLGLHENTCQKKGSV